MVNENELKNLRDRILKAASDPKGARIAVSVFNNQAGREEALFFLDYLSSSDPAQKKMARLVLGHFGVLEALPILVEEIETAIGHLTFLPADESRESVLFPGLIEAFETIFAIIRAGGVKDRELAGKCEEIFKKTRNEDLRFTLIKIILFSKHNFDFFLELWPSLSDKEHRAVYYTTSLTEDQARRKIFQLGLQDENNFEFAVSNMIRTPEGIELLAAGLSEMDDAKKQIVLNKLNDEKIYAVEDALIDIIRDDSNRYVTDLAVEILKKGEKEKFPAETFLDFLNTGYTAEMVRSSLEIIEHFLQGDSVSVLITALEKQPLFKNKSLILEKLVKVVKTHHGLDGELSQKILAILMPYFESYSEEKEDLLITIMRILPQLLYSGSVQLKNVRRRLLEYAKFHESGISVTLKNNFQEGLAKLSQVAQKFEESEAKTRKLLLLFDIDPHKIESERISFLKEELREIDSLSDEFRQKLEQYLLSIVSDETQDWRKRALAIELLGDYGHRNTMDLLHNLAREEKSLGVKVSAQQALKRIRQRWNLPEPAVLLLESIFYAVKLISDFCQANDIKCLCLKDISEFPAHADQAFEKILLSDAFLERPEMKELFAYLADRKQVKLLIITADPQKIKMDLPPGHAILPRPFNAGNLADILLKEN